MKSFKQFAKIEDNSISDDVVIASTNYAGFAGVWTVGLASEATHNGTRISGARSSAKWSKSRGRFGAPSQKCLNEMIDYARQLSA